jgi:hypothetical protein
MTSADLAVSIGRGARRLQRRFERVSGNTNVSGSPGESAPTRVHVLDDEWLDIVMAPSARHSGDASILWKLLQFNEETRGSARATLSMDGKLEFRAEAYIGARSGDQLDDARPETAGLIETLHAELIHASACCAEAILKGVSRTATATPASAFNAAELAHMCIDAGWKGISSEPDAVLVDLEVPGITAVAQLRVNDGSILEAVVRLGTGASTSNTCHAAIAALLLRVSASVRLVKGIVCLRDGTESAGLSAQCGWPSPTADALHRVLAALAVACQYSSREVQALQDPRLADEYLGRRWPQFTTTPTITSDELEETCLPLP